MTKATILSLIRQASLETGVSCETLLSRRREPEIARLRFAVMKTARDLGYSKTQIGRRLMRDGSTVFSGVKRAEQIASVDPGFRALLRKIRFEADRCGCPECLELDAMPFQGIEDTFQLRLTL